jgi:hypothetical protein
MNGVEPVLEDAAPANGRIVTFYSYKGGTGRSMAVANVAWILACNGCRVLVIDWDLEAPGLHRYYRPFLSDPELSNTPGLIDFFVHFAEAARIEARSTAQSAAAVPWFEHRADLVRYSVALDYEFPKDGILDYVGAGQQGPSYSVRVNSFQWGEFYEKLGGGAFLGCVKSRLRERYDYVLIDSRTGLSDTSGICTVQMPDDLVVCFTLNRQSIFGAAATAQSADAQRRLPTGQPGLRIWPVPTRVELHEKDRLDAARALARQQFAPLLWHVPARSRSDYWGGAEVLYFPYYAYEETLATIADRPRQTASLLNAMERLTSSITLGAVSAMPSLQTGEREQLLNRLEAAIRPPRPRTPRFFLSYAASDASVPILEELASLIELRFGPDAILWDKKIPLGTKITAWLDRALDDADVIIAAIGPSWGPSSNSFREVERALKHDKTVIPLLVNDAEFSQLPEYLRDVQAVKVSRVTMKSDLQDLVNQLTAVDVKTGQDSVEVEVDDPNKGQFGGKPARPGRRLTARVSPAPTPEWFLIDLLVESDDATPLTGEVDFHLHPTFKPSVVRVPVQNGRAAFSVPAWGAFTVGAVVDNGLTRLELNLADLPDAPTVFRDR